MTTHNINVIVDGMNEEVIFKMMKVPWRNA